MNHRVACWMLAFGALSVPSSYSASRSTPPAPGASNPTAFTASQKIVPILRKPAALSRTDLSFLLALGSGLVALQLRRKQSLLTARRVPAQGLVAVFTD